MKRTSQFVILVIAVCCSAARAQRTGREYWNQYRGPDGNGASAATSLPLEFSESRNLRWKVPIPGVGWSSPVVWDRQVWCTSGREDGKQLFAICLDANTGKVIHKIKVFDVADPGMEWSNQNPHACPTPFVEPGRVYVHYGSYGTACLDTASGAIVWQRTDLKCNHRVGPASSPIVSGDSLFLQFDGVDVQYVAALDKATGDTLWTKQREVTSDLAARLRQQGLSEAAIAGTLEKKPGDNRKSYATPTIIEVQGRRQLISPAAEVLFSYDPQTGAELWRVEYAGWAWNVACRPVFANGLVYATTGISRNLVAVRPDGRGNVTDSHVEWSADKGVPNMSSPLIVDGTLLMVGDRGGIVVCLDAMTGERLWQKRIGGNHWASPLYAGGRLYFSSKEGEVAVLAASKQEPELLATNKLNASFIASPAVAGDSLILRSTTHVYCLADGYERTPQQVAQDVYPQRNPREQGSVKLPADDEKLAALKSQLTKLVGDGKLSRDEQTQLLRLAAGSKTTSKADADAELSEKEWEAAYERLLKETPPIREKVANGGATKQQVIAWMKKQGKQGKPIARPAPGKFRERLAELVESGRLTQRQALELDRSFALKEAAEMGKDKGKDKGEGKGEDKGEGKGNIKGKDKPGATNFYAIVVGRLKSKDFEVGEFSLEVDYVTSIFANRWVKNEIVGETVKVEGVSGEFRDKLLLIKRGETVKVRTASYRKDSSTLGFGHKFQVLERCQPFKPEDFGVPPDPFRGFRGVLQGKVVEAGGYEVLLAVNEVVKVANGSKAADAESIRGRRIRIVGFYNQHSDKFADLHQGDSIRLGVSHANPTHDELTVTDTLEKVR